MNRPTEMKLKDPYSTPKLTIYGTIEQLTKAVGPHINADGGVFPKDRTQL
jgi:hypothetical protein